MDWRLPGLCVGVAFPRAREPLAAGTAADPVGDGPLLVWC